MESVSPQTNRKSRLLKRLSANTTGGKAVNDLIGKTRGGQNVMRVLGEGLKKGEKSFELRLFDMLQERDSKLVKNRGNLTGYVFRLKQIAKKLPIATNSKTVAQEAEKMLEKCSRISSDEKQEMVNVLKKAINLDKKEINEKFQKLIPKINTWLDAFNASNTQQSKTPEKIKWEIKVVKENLNKALQTGSLQEIEEQLNRLDTNINLQGLRSAPVESREEIKAPVRQKRFAQTDSLPPKAKNLKKNPVSLFIELAESGKSLGYIERAFLKEKLVRTTEGWGKVLNNLLEQISLLDEIDLLEFDDNEKLVKQYKDVDALKARVLMLQGYIAQKDNALEAALAAYKEAIETSPDTFIQRYRDVDPVLVRKTIQSYAPGAAIKKVGLYLIDAKLAGRADDVSGMERAFAQAFNQVSPVSEFLKIAQALIPLDQEIADVSGRSGLRDLLQSVARKAKGSEVKFKANFALGKLYEANDPAKALTYYSEALKGSPRRFLKLSGQVSMDLAVNLIRTNIENGTFNKHRLDASARVILHNRLVLPDNKRAVLLDLLKAYPDNLSGQLQSERLVDCESLIDALRVLSKESKQLNAEDRVLLYRALGDLYVANEQPVFAVSFYEQLIIEDMSAFKEALKGMDLDLAMRAVAQFLSNGKVSSADKVKGNMLLAEVHKLRNEENLSEHARIRAEVQKLDPRVIVKEVLKAEPIVALAVVRSKIAKTKPEDKNEWARLHLLESRFSASNNDIKGAELACQKALDAGLDIVSKTASLGSLDILTKTLLGHAKSAASNAEKSQAIVLRAQLMISKGVSLDVLDSTISMLRLAVSQDPSNADARRYLGTMLMRNKTGEYGETNYNEGAALIKELADEGDTLAQAIHRNIVSKVAGPEDNSDLVDLSANLNLERILVDGPSSAEDLIQGGEALLLQSDMIFAVAHNEDLANVFKRSVALHLNGAKHLAEVDPLLAIRNELMVNKDPGLRDAFKQLVQVLASMQYNVKNISNVGKKNWQLVIPIEQIKALHKAIEEVSVFIKPDASEVVGGSKIHTGVNVKDPLQELKDRNALINSLEYRVLEKIISVTDKLIDPENNYSRGLVEDGYRVRTAIRALEKDVRSPASMLEKLQGSNRFMTDLATITKLLMQEAEEQNQIFQQCDSVTEAIRGVYYQMVKDDALPQDLEQLPQGIEQIASEAESKVKSLIANHSGRVKDIEPEVVSILFAQLDKLNTIHEKILVNASEERTRLAELDQALEAQMAAMRARLDAMEAQANNADKPPFGLLDEIVGDEVTVETSKDPDTVAIEAMMKELGVGEPSSSNDDPDDLFADMINDLGGDAGSQTLYDVDEAGLSEILKQAES